MAQATDRLLSQLNATQLQQKDNPTYQVIKQLIQRIKDLEGLINSGNTTNITNEIIQQYFLSGGDSDSGNGEIGPPGIRGADGAIGPTGASGNSFPFMLPELDEPETPIGPIKGDQGLTGNTGATGADGQSFPFMLPEPDMGEDPLMIPGRDGASGNGGPWSLLSTTTADGTVGNYDYNNLSSYSEIMVVFDGITKSASQTLLLRVSTDNGSTFLNSSGDYIQIAANGQETDDTAITLHATAATAARSGCCVIRAFNIASVSRWVETTASVVNFIIPSATALNAIRILTNSGLLNAGKIYIFGRI